MHCNIQIIAYLHVPSACNRKGEGMGGRSSPPNAAAAAAAAGPRQYTSHTKMGEGDQPVVRQLSESVYLDAGDAKRPLIAWQ